jgi:hypothetical protein
MQIDYSWKFGDTVICAGCHAEVACPNCSKPAALLVAPEPAEAETEPEPKTTKLPILSILICSLKARAEMLAALLRDLNAMRGCLDDPGAVEILCKVDNKEVSVGAKRNKLMARASGEYLCFIDDDDRVTSDYFSAIFAALKTKPDVVGICGIVTWEYRRPMIFRHDLQYRQERNLPNILERLPHHLCPTRSEIAKRFPFGNINLGEDSGRAHGMMHARALHSCVMIERPIYLYDYRKAVTETQEGRAGQPPRK